MGIIKGLAIVGYQPSFMDWAKRKLKESIKNEDYETAAELKHVIKVAEQNSTQINVDIK